MDYTLTSIIARSDAVARIAERTRLPGEREREARNKVSKRIGYAVKTGKLGESAPGHFLFGELSVWARDTWPQLFRDWPAAGSASLVSGGKLADFFDALVLPTTIERCHQVIAEMHEKIRHVEQHLAEAHLEIAQLRPDAKRWQEFRDGNKENGRRPRK